MEATDGDGAELLSRAHQALTAGRPGDAERLLARLVTGAGAQPRADVLHLLALAQRQQGRRHEAIATLARAATAPGASAPIWNNLGGMRREAGDVAGAAQAFRSALSLAPGQPSALYNLSGLLLADGRVDEAVPLLEQLVLSTPDDAAAWNLLGLAVSRRGDVARAVQAMRRARDLAPRGAAIANELGVMLGYAGDRDGARQCFRDALALDPGHAWAWENLVRSQRVGSGDEPLVRQMEAALGQAAPGSPAAVCLGFALGKALDDLGRVDEAFARYRDANDVLARNSPFDPAAFDGYVDRIVATFDDALLSRLARHALAGARPVFVVGMPRSGTTLVEQVLASAPGVRAAGELSVVPRAVAGLENACGAAYPQAAAAAAPGPLAAFARRTADGVAAAMPGAHRVIDKLPSNAVFLGLLAALLPDATLIHCRRDPRDTGLSIYFQRFDEGHHFASSLGAIGRVHGAHERLMAHWRRLLGPRLVEVDYEALVADPQAEGRRLCEAAGAGWSPGQLDRVGAGAVRTASSWQVREPVHAGSVGRWRRYAAHLGELDAALHP